MLRAVIMAGGLGTRLRPFTTVIPKPLVPIGGKYSVLEVVLIQLKAQGFTRVTLAVNHFSNLIMAYFGDGSRLGIEIDYSLEEKPLSTIGPLTLIDDLPENFLVMNGDILCDLDYGKFLAGHADSDNRITVAAYKRSVGVDFGVLETDSNGRLVKFTEKPSYDIEVSMGVYAISRRAISALEPNQPYGFDTFMLDSIKNSMPVKIEQFSGFWLDIGRPDDYQYADENFAEIAKKLRLILD